MEGDQDVGGLDVAVDDALLVRVLDRPADGDEQPQPLARGEAVAIAVLGFLAGGKLATAMAAAFFVHYAQYSTIIFVAGGVIGAILLLAVFGWALIVVSAFIGAYLIKSAVVLPPTGSTLVFIGLAIIGILVQAASFRRSAI